MLPCELWEKFWKLFEIVMLIISLHTFCGQKPQLYVQTAAVFFTLNLLDNTFFVFMQMKVQTGVSESGFLNGTFLATDTIIDFMCFCLNMSFLKSADLTQNRIRPGKNWFLRSKSSDF